MWARDYWLVVGLNVFRVFPGGPCVRGAACSHTECTPHQPFLRHVEWQLQRIATMCCPCKCHSLLATGWVDPAGERSDTKVVAVRESYGIVHREGKGGPHKMKRRQAKLFEYTSF